MQQTVFVTVILFTLEAFVRGVFIPGDFTQLGRDNDCGPNNDLGVGYEPFHSDLYPMHGGDPGRIPEILDNDMQQLSPKFGYIRTYYSQYYGIPVAQYVANHNLKAYLGIFPYDRQDWFDSEIQAGVDACRTYPENINALLFGNENLPGAGGSYTVDMILNQVSNIKNKLNEAGVQNVPVGTAQRITEWVDQGNRDEMDRLANGVDIIGVHIYPFFSPGWNRDDPTAQLNAQWNLMLERYPDHVDKIRLLESGWSSQGNAPDGLPDNVPNDENQKAYFEALKNWEHGQCDRPRFWFAAFDRRADDPFLDGHPEFERYFGLYTSDGSSKPVLG